MFPQINLIWQESTFYGVLLHGSWTTHFVQITCMGKCGENTPDSKVHGANMGPIWGWEDPGGPHVSPMNYAIWDYKKQQAI